MSCIIIIIIISYFHSIQKKDHIFPCAIQFFVCFRILIVSKSTAFCDKFILTFCLFILDNSPVLPKWFKALSAVPWWSESLPVQSGCRFMSFKCQMLSVHLAFSCPLPAGPATCPCNDALNECTKHSLLLIYRLTSG